MGLADWQMSFPVPELGCAGGEVIFPDPEITFAEVDLDFPIAGTDKLISGWEN